MKKVIFLHGFFASGSCLPALTLKEAHLYKSPRKDGKQEFVIDDALFEKVTRDGRTFNRFLETGI
jgi:hypothetical protein